MRLKTFTAPTMPEALRMIRQDLGPEALILSTRKVAGKDGKPTLEITAALEGMHATTAATAAPESPPAWLQAARDAAKAPPPVAGNQATRGLAGILQAQQLDWTLIERLLAALPGLVSAGFNHSEAIEMLLQKMLQFKPLLELLPNGTAHVLVGMNGAGKTTLMSKLALMSRSQGRSVGLLSLDDEKIAGFEPLAVVAEALGDSAHLLSNSADMRAAASKLGPRHVVLIDTPGLNMYQPTQLQKLQQRLEGLGIPYQVHLVVPATLNALEMMSLPTAFARFKPASLMLTMLDCTTRFGPMISLAAQSGLSLGLASDSAAVSAPPVLLNAGWLAEALCDMPQQPWEFAA